MEALLRADLDEVGQRRFREAARIDVAVVGIKNAAQITEAIGAMGKTISREDYFAVRKTLAIEGISKIKDAGGERK